MGRDAVVWKCREMLPPEIPQDLLSYDPTTGEYWVEGIGARDKYPRELFIAADKHLGNLAMIADLRATLRPMLGGLPMLSQVLWSGVHGGDQIQSADAATLEVEVETLLQLEISQDATVKHFLDNLFELARASIEHKNPIVFS